MKAGNNLCLINFFQTVLFLYQISVVNLVSDSYTVVINYPMSICLNCEDCGHLNLLSIKRTKQESMYISIN